MQLRPSSFADKLARFGFRPSCYALFPVARRAIDRHAPAALRRLYDHIGTDAEARAFFTTPGMMDHARDKQLDHWQALFSGKPDERYEARATRIGNVHARIGLSPSWYISSYARVLEHILPRMLRWSPLRPFERRGLGATVLVRSALLDMDVALSAYFAAEQQTRAAAIETLGQALDALARGDFSSPMAALPPEYAALAANFEEMRTRVCATLGEVTAAADRIATGSAEINQASSDLSQRTEHQAATLEQTAASMDEVTSGVSDTAAASVRASGAVGEMRAGIEQSGTLVGEAIGAMRRIEASSSEIGEIISVIDGIAFQTNLLALNAGVEAARAGDAGKGFAVVASEVRALAQRSADAAKDVKTKINASTEQVEAGVQLVSDTGKALQRIVDRIGEVSDLVAGIARSAESQAVSLRQVNTAVSEMDGTTQQNAAMVEQATAASRSLATEAGALSRRVGTFRLDATPAAAASLPPPAPRTPAARPRLAAVAGAALRDDDWSSF